MNFACTVVACHFRFAHFAHHGFASSLEGFSGTPPSTACSDFHCWPLALSTQTCRVAPAITQPICRVFSATAQHWISRTKNCPTSVWPPPHGCTSFPMFFQSSHKFFGPALCNLVNAPAPVWPIGSFLCSFLLCQLALHQDVDALTENEARSRAFQIYNLSSYSGRYISQANQSWGPCCRRDR